MSFIDDIKKIFKGGAPKKEDAEFKLYTIEARTKREIKRLEIEKQKLAVKYKSLREGSKEFDDTIKAFNRVEKDWAKCKRTLDVIADTKGRLIGGTSKTGVFNANDALSEAMREIVTITEPEPETGKMSAEEIDKTKYIINKRLEEFPEDGIQEWEEILEETSDDFEYASDELDRASAIDKMEAIYAESRKKSSEKIGKLDGELNKEIEDDLAKIKADRKKLESETND